MMNKQEAIKLVEQMGEYERFVDEPVSKKSVLDIISQIDEPQKVTVPKFVAEWIKEHKEDGSRLSHALEDVFDDVELSLYIKQQEDDYTETIAEAWVAYPNIIVEQEKLYTVEIPNPNCPDIATFLYKENGKVFIGTDIFLDEVPNYKWKNEPENQLTEAEIKKDFEWAWQFAKEVE